MSVGRLGLVLLADDLGDGLELDVAGALVDGANLNDTRSTPLLDTADASSVFTHLAIAVELLDGEVLCEADTAHHLDAL